MGYHQVYSGGWAVKDHTKLFYKEVRETSDQFISRIFMDIFMNKNLNCYTFYVHNLGRFDSVFILKSLIINKNFEITPIWKDNTIISLTISLGDFKIFLLDSLQLIPGSLKDILISFGCKTQKGNFPYKFVNKNNLYYIGDKPSKEFYSDITELEYLNLSNNKWDLKLETLKYLRSDLEGLLEVVTEFRDNVYNKYNLNITKFKTLPGLALAVYRSSYLPESFRSELKIIKSDLAQKIRTSYFGGNVEVYIN